MLPHPISLTYQHRTERQARQSELSAHAEEVTRAVNIPFAKIVMREVVSLLRLIKQVDAFQ